MPLNFQVLRLELINNHKVNQRQVDILFRYYSNHLINMSIEEAVNFALLKMKIIGDKDESTKDK